VVAAPARRRPAPPATAKPTARQAHPVAGPSELDVVLRVPPGLDRIKVAIELDRGAAAPLAETVPDRPDALRLAGGRRLPTLLFVTNREALAANLGVAETEMILAAIAADDSAVLYDQLPTDPADPAESPASVREQLQSGGVTGVVILGGPTVVPPQRRDCLPDALRARLGHTDDPDDFIVWSDAVYGDVDGDHLAELPVSRIPDGNSAQLVIAALCASDEVRQPARTGLRNVARPFADAIYDRLPGTDPLEVSQPTTFESVALLGGERVYLMLHGDYVDSSRFWGEDTRGDLEAVNLTNIAPGGTRVVFTGCCWGALTADQPARWAVPGIAPAGKAAGTSIALAFLQQGSTAFVGCTGAHYSPTEAPYDYFGGPMHEAFWSRAVAGTPPAQALFEAKIDYLAGFPHGRPTALQQAIEYKILYEYTCLGLGW
jgi:hypothetical protein